MSFSFQKIRDRFPREINRKTLPKSSAEKDVGRISNCDDGLTVTSNKANNNIKNT